jgi:hypothetical protein
MPVYKVTSKEARKQGGKKRKECTRKVQGMKRREKNRVLVTRIVTFRMRRIILRGLSSKVEAFQILQISIEFAIEVLIKMHNWFSCGLMTPIWQKQAQLFQFV